MKRWLLHIWMMGVLVMLAASCSQEAEGLEPDVNNGGRVQLNFTIVLDDSPASRTWGDHEADTDSNATLAENAVNNLQILLFNADGDEYCGTLENVQYFSVDPLDKIYEFQGSISLEADDYLVESDVLNCKIMVLANCSVTIEEDATMTQVLEALNAKTFAASDIYTAGTGLKAGIPMWGIHTVEGLSVDRNYATYLEDDIYLLRSMAKIEVTLSDETWANGYRITSATLNKYNAEGYVVPAFPGTTTGTFTTMNTTNLATLGATTDLSLEGVLREKADLATNPSTLGFTETTAYRTYVVYVPEMTKDTSNPIRMDLGLGKVSGTDANGNETLENITGSVMGGTPHIELKDYNGNNGYYNIIRNWYYRYTINSISDGVNLELTCIAMPWNLISETVNYTNNPSAADGGKIEFTDVTPSDRKDNSGNILGYDVLLNTQTTSASFTFTLASPLGYRWIATLVPMGDGNSAANCPFYFDDNGTSLGLETSGIIDGKPVSLTLKTTATDGVDDDKEALLRIIVLKGDGTSVILDKSIIGGPFYIKQNK